MTEEVPQRVWPPGCVIVHHHLFKNAGTTVDWILRRVFGPGFLDHEAAIAAGLTSAETLLDFVLARPDIHAVSRHHLSFATMSHPGRAFLDILLVRHPIDRLRSMYDFLRAEPVAHDDVGALAQRLDLRAFCHALLDRFPNYVNNPQVTTLVTAGTYLRPPDEGDAQRAIDLVRRAGITGPVERFDDAFMAAEYYLQPLYGRLDLAYVAQNTAPGRQPALDQRLAACRHVCGNSLYRHLVRVNELDFELVRAAEVELTRRTKLIPQYDQRRAAYRERCRRLRETASTPGPEPAPTPAQWLHGAPRWRHIRSHATDMAARLLRSARRHHQ